MKPDELAIAIRVRPETITKDMKVLRKAMVKQVRSAPALQNVIKENLMVAINMIMADRGRALEQYERVRAQAYNEDGTPRREIGEDAHEISYEMVAFLKSAQESSKQLLTAINSIAGRPTFIQNVVDNSVTVQQNTFNMTDAIRLLQEQPAGVRALPLSGGREVKGDIDFVDYSEALA